jgi:CCR4-NOT transcriptional regulation complex NOT5 subunit
MQNVNADPDKLKSLGKEMIKVGEQIEELSRTLRRKLDASGWNDSERQKFESDLTPVVKELQEKSQKIRSEFVPKLNRKASALEQYRRG